MTDQFGAHIKARREALGYTEEMLAQAVGIQPWYLADIEDGKAKSSTELDTKILQALDSREGLRPKDRHTRARELYVEHLVDLLDESWEKFTAEINLLKADIMAKAEAIAKAREDQ